MSDPGPQVSTQSEMFGALLEVTGWRVPAVSPSRVGKLARDLLAAGVFPYDVRLRFGTLDPGEGWWWFRDDWRGRLGQRPDEKGLRECAGRWEQAVAVQVREPAGFAALRALREARLGQ
jgi:hypothetical protein